MIHPYYKPFGVKLKVKELGQQQQQQQQQQQPISFARIGPNLQATYSFPLEKSWLSLKAIVSFLHTKSQAQGQAYKFGNQESAAAMANLVAFIDVQDATLRNLSPNAKFFMFFMLNYFIAGKREGCHLGAFAKTITGPVLLRTKVIELLKYGGQNSVQIELGHIENPANLVINAYRRYLAATSGPQARLCSKQNSQDVFFATTFDGDVATEFPFSASSYLYNLFDVNNPRDLFEVHADTFDNSFGRFPLVVGNQRLVIFELRTLAQFYFDSSNGDLLKQFATIIPTLYNLGRSISRVDNVAAVDQTLKMCAANGQLVNYDANAVQGPMNAQNEQQRVTDARTQRRDLEQQISQQRQNRRDLQNNNGGSNTLYDDEEVDVLDTAPENISLLREERRRVRVQKRIDREKRREQEVRSNSSSVPTEKQVRREALRLAREKKRLAREEERDISEGVKPVTQQDLTQMIQQQEAKKHAAIKHNVVKTSNGGTSVEIKLRLY
nr:unnamed protein product [Naegleria fowleri]